MTVEGYWESMGYLNDLDKQEKAHALRLYEAIQELMENSEDFKNLLKRTGVSELWNSYLPKTYEEWFKCSLNGLGFEVTILKDICKFDENIWNNLIYSVVYNLLTRYNNFDVIDLIDALANITVKPLLNTKEVTNFKSYGELYEFVLKVVSVQCAMFFDINKILDDLTE